MRNFPAVFLFLNLLVLYFSLESQALRVGRAKETPRYSNKPSRNYCRDPKGYPGDVVCLDEKITSCQCVRTKCRWAETDISCNDGDSNSTSCQNSGLHEDIRNALDTPSSCLQINCNCLAQGNFISQQSASSFQDCAAVCNNFQPGCKAWTYVPPYSTCLILTNCNNIRCGHPFNGWVSGPSNCPGQTIDSLTQGATFQFNIINLVSGKTATGKVIFVGSQDSRCEQTYSITNKTTSATLTVPIACNPLAVIQATSSNNLICTPYSTTNPPYPLPNFYICPTNGGSNCQVFDNPQCKSNKYGY